MLFKRLSFYSRRKAGRESSKIYKENQNEKAILMIRVLKNIFTLTFKFLKINSKIFVSLMKFFFFQVSFLKGFDIFFFFFPSLIFKGIWYSFFFLSSLFSHLKNRITRRFTKIKYLNKIKSHLQTWTAISRLWPPNHSMPQTWLNPRVICLLPKMI